MISKFIILNLKNGENNSLIWFIIVSGWMEKTIKRKLTEDDLIYTELLKFKRIWSYTSDIISLNNNKVYCGVFLDIEKDEKFSINVCGLKVTDDEFNDISLREKNIGYDRCNGKY